MSEISETIENLLEKVDLEISSLKKRREVLLSRWANGVYPFHVGQRTVRKGVEVEVRSISGVKLFSKPDWVAFLSPIKKDGTPSKRVFASYGEESLGANDGRNS